MLPSTHPPLLELQTQLWKARAQAKQKWLERSLQEPTDDPSETARRALWVKRALEAVKRAQATMKYNAALVDAYSEHLSDLEMTLMSAAERQLVTSNGKPEKQRE
jgi:hypothetical protein